MTNSNRIRLFSPLELGAVTLKNRIAVAPMCQYSAVHGFANDWHFVHLGRFAIGGAGLVMVEATAVLPEGRITHGDLGIWDDLHIPQLERIAGFLQSQGTAAGIQLAHAGRKASMQKPWDGNGPLQDIDFARGDIPWTVMAPSPIPVDEGWLLPKEMSQTDIEAVKLAWSLAASRAARAGFDVLEIHCAHGYLLHSFLSSLTNTRSDRYGGSLKSRCRLPLEVVEIARSAWPSEKPLFVRVSSVDGLVGGWTMDDTIYLAKELKTLGVDVIDCSSGGLSGSPTGSLIPRGLGFQVPYASRVRKEAGMKTMAVGLILDGHQAEAILEAGASDLIAIGREMMFDPNWPLHAQQALTGQRDFELWPKQAGWWLSKREKSMVLSAQKGN